MENLSLSLLVKQSQIQYPLQFQVIGFQGDSAVSSRLSEMGLKIGQHLSLEGRGPFGGPFLLRFGTTVLAIRNEEAACLIVKRSIV